MCVAASSAISILIIMMIMMMVMMMMVTLLFLVPCVVVLAVLRLPESGVERVWRLEQLRVSALLRQPALSDDQDLVAVDHSGQSVGDDNRGAALGGALQSRHDGLLSDGVQAGGGLVEDKYGSVFQDSPEHSHGRLVLDKDRYLAMATRCFSPPDNFSPLSPT